VVVRNADVVALPKAGTIPAPGGYGDPLLHRPDLAANDVRDGKVSRHAARPVYGVLLNDSDEVDQPATKQLRAGIRADRSLHYSGSLTRGLAAAFRPGS
jgi:hypothetical protein